jgi:hypothetical protein
MPQIEIQTHKEGCNVISCVDGDCNAPKGRLVAPGPDCRDGKHGICDQVGWDMLTDGPTDCPCDCHEAGD